MDKSMKSPAFLICIVKRINS